MVKNKNSKSETMASQLRSELKGGLYPVGSRFPSEYELAERFQVNKTTANKVVGLLVAEGFLERRTSGGGTGVVRNTVFPEGMLVYLTAAVDDFYARLLHGSQQGAYSRGYLVSYLSVNPDNLDFALDQLTGAKVRGMLTSCYGRISRELPFPVVHVDRVLSNGGAFNTVINDYYHGGCLIGECLLKYGHRDIVYFSSDPVPEHMSLRRKGTFDVLARAGVGNLERRFFPGEFSSFGALARLKQARKRFPHLTAIVCDTDNDASSVHKLMGDAGFDPERISLAGYGNVHSVQRVQPLTTIDQHPVEMGNHAANLLIDIIEGHVTPPCSEVMDVELLDRGSIRPVNGLI